MRLIPLLLHATLFMLHRLLVVVGSRFRPAFVTTKPQRQQQQHGVRTFWPNKVSRLLTTTTTTTTTAAVSNNKEDTLYQELQLLSRELKRHDELYYQSSNPEISDEEYDALARREEEICQSHPHLMKRWQTDSGWGASATRYGGRVGATLISTTTTSTSPSTTTATTASGRIRRQHAQPMLSLDNVHDNAQLLAWLERVRKKLEPETTVTILTEPKLDGLSLNLRYESNGKGVWKLMWASTRGDGRQGQDVSSAVRSCASVPQTIAWGDDKDDVVEVRGEVVLPHSIFQQHVLSTADDENRTRFSNARNAAAGILLRKEDSADDDDEEDWGSKLCFYAYGLFSPSCSLDGMEAQDALTGLGFRIPQPVVTTTLKVENETEWNDADIANMLKYHDALQEHRKEDPDSDSAAKNNFQWGDYDMDGCVHKVSENNLRVLLGNSNRAPRWAVAHKFPPTAVVTSLLDVYVQVGRTGALTPVALLKPVELAGVSIQRATLHNFGHMQSILGSNESVAQGAEVLVRRAGEVIPQVVAVVGGENATSNGSFDKNSMISLVAPTKCPSCGSDVVVETSANANRTAGRERVSVGQVLRCGGPPLLCAPRAVSALRHAFSRDALDVSGLSEARIQQLMDLDLLRIPSDIFTLAQDPENLVERLSTDVDGWGEKSARNLASSANKVATEGVSLTRYIYSLGIRFVGVHSSALLAAVYGSAGSFLKDLEEAGKNDGNSDPDEAESLFRALREETEATKGIGPSILSSLVAFSRENELVDAAKALASIVTVHDDESLSASSTTKPLAPTPDTPLTGKSVVFTGSLPGLTRARANELAKQMGAKATPGTITKATDLVVYGEKGGKKLQQATALGIDVMEADEFIKLIESFHPENV